MLGGVIGLVVALVGHPALVAAPAAQQGLAPRENSTVEPTSPRDANPKEGSHEFSWERPGTVSIYDLQFGSAELKDNQLELADSNRTFSAGQYADRLILMVRFSYRASRREIPLKFVIRLPEARQYEETVRLPNMKGQVQFSLHHSTARGFSGNRVRLPVLWLQHRGRAGLYHYAGFMTRAAFD